MDGLPLERREALPCSRIFWIWADRFGLRGRGGGGIWFGCETVARWRLFKAVRLDANEESREEMALVAGSIVRGSRVNVSSMFEEVVMVVEEGYVYAASPQNFGSGGINGFR